MDAQLQLTLTQSDFSALRESSEGNVSQFVRDVLENLDLNVVKAHLDTNKTTCRIDMDLAKKLQEIADALHVAPGRVARAAIEARLHKTHH